MANVLLIIGNDPANRLYIDTDIMDRHALSVLGCVDDKSPAMISLECSVTKRVIEGESLDAGSLGQSRWVLSGAAGVKPAETYVIQVPNRGAAQALLAELPPAAVRDRMALLIEDDVFGPVNFTSTSCLLLILGSNRNQRLSLDPGQLRGVTGLTPVAMCSTGQSTLRAMYGESAQLDGTTQSLAVLSSDPAAQVAEAYVLHFDGRASALQYLASTVNRPALDGRVWLLLDKALA